MATKKICDRCGAEINPKESMTRIDVWKYLCMIERRVELCVSCGFHLQKWLDRQED